MERGYICHFSRQKNGIASCVDLLVALRGIQLRGCMYSVSQLVDSKCDVSTYPASL